MYRLSKKFIFSLFYNLLLCFAAILSPKFVYKTLTIQNIRRKTTMIVIRNPPMTVRLDELTASPQRFRALAVYVPLSSARRCMMFKET